MATGDQKCGICGGWAANCKHLEPIIVKYYDNPIQRRGCRGSIECKACGYTTTMDKPGLINHEKKTVGAGGPCLCIGPEKCGNCGAGMRTPITYVKSNEQYSILNFAGDQPIKWPSNIAPQMYFWTEYFEFTDGAGI